MIYHSFTFSASSFPTNLFSPTLSLVSVIFHIFQIYTTIFLAFSPKASSIFLPLSMYLRTHLALTFLSFSLPNFTLTVYFHTFDMPQSYLQR